MLIDTHSHLNFNVYKNDSYIIIQRSLENGVWMINVGSQYTSSERAVRMAEKYQEGVYAAIGLHPIHSQDGFEYEKYKKLVESKKVVALGEIGLDYKPEYLFFKEKQKEVFLQQLDLAEELDLPVIFHCRQAHQDLIDILYNLRNNDTMVSKLRKLGVVHCFTGSWPEAQKYLEMGFYLGFNGIIFKLDLNDVIRRTPLEKILVETDCPYLTPPQEQGRNEPIFVRHVVKRIAELQRVSFEKVAEITFQNAKELFKV